jgi:hypothetical protein
MPSRLLDIQNFSARLFVCLHVRSTPVSRMWENKKKMWKESTVASSKALFRYCAEGIKENHENLTHDSKAFIRRTEPGTSNLSIATHQLQCSDPAFNKF